MANYIEDQIRDKLVSNLSLLEEGLVFVNKEEYLPHSLGTRGFVDILARDAQGYFVLIELKRSDAACREALHEVLKYIEAAKENFKVNEDEIRVFVVSTEWKELLVPFSSFVKRVDCTVQGYNLQVDGDCTPTAAITVVPSSLNTDRLLSRRHAVNLYTSEEDLERGLESHIVVMQDRGIKDYVLLKLEAALGLHEWSVQSTYASSAALSDSLELEQPMFTIEELREKMTEFPYMLYFAIQQIEVEEYLNMLSKEPKVREEVIDYSRTASEEETLLYAEDLALYSLSPRIYVEHWEVGNPAKFINILDQEQWHVTSILRFGAFAKNTSLSDQIILDELRGSQGVTRQKYSKIFDSNNRARINRIKREVKNCLVDNPVWSSHILQIFDYIGDLMDTENFSGKVYIFNPNNILQSVYMLMEYDNGLMYVPMYYVNIDFSSELSITYYGAFKFVKACLPLSSILEKYYEGDAAKMALPLMWGGYEERDNEIMMDIGLEPTTFVVKRESENVTYFQFSDQRLLPSTQELPFDGIIRFVEENPKFAEAVASAFAEHHIGGMYMS